jgi:hypothetical protein
VSSKIEVTGTFVFHDGLAEFVFGENTMQFHRVSNMDELRAALVGIATYGTQASIEFVMASGGKTEQPPQAKEGVVEKSERSFREFEQKAQEHLVQAQKDYEAATANVLPKV